MGMLEILTIVFIILKLVGVISWSWFWVLSPLIVSFTLIALVIIKEDKGKKKMSDKVENSGGIGFLGLLTILFIGLKLTGYITWSWFWVLSPTLLPLIFVVTILVGWFLIYIVPAYIINKEVDNKLKKEKQKEEKYNKIVKGE